MSLTTPAKSVTPRASPPFTRLIFPKAKIGTKATASASMRSDFVAAQFSGLAKAA